MKEYNTFNVFLYDALNQKILIPKEKFIKIPVEFFNLNSEIKEDYENNNLNIFIKNNCTRDSKYLLMNKKNLKTKEAYLTVMYYLFSNQLYKMIDDYGNNYYVKSPIIVNQ